MAKGGSGEVEARKQKGDYYLCNFHPKPPAAEKIVFCKVARDAGYCRITIFLLCR